MDHKIGFLCNRMLLFCLYFTVL